MQMEGKRVNPDARKDLVRISRGLEGLTHFKWLDRSSDLVEDDQIVFPNEAVFEKVDQTSGRVYILKFNGDDRKSSFGCKSQVQKAMLNYVAQSTTSSTNHLFAVHFHDNDIITEFRNDANFSSVLLACPLLPEGEPIKNHSWILEKICFIHSGLGLGDILKPELIMPFIDMLVMEQQLFSYLPEGHQIIEDLLELLHSPPFRQQVDSFTYVLRTGLIDLSQFGINPTKYKLTVLSFLEGFEDLVSADS